jgi:hypothetical protein
VFELRTEACRLRRDVTARRLAQAAEVDARLAQLGRPLGGGAALIQGAQTSLEQAQELWDKRDYQGCYDATTRAMQLVARVRRGHWEQTARAFPSPAASPCIAQFTTLPLHWAFAARIAGPVSSQASTWGPNVQAAGDMESLDQMLRAGWQQQRFVPEGIGADVSLSLADPHSGRSALRMQAGAADEKRSPRIIERPPVWVVSSPVPVRQGQLVRIHGWAQVPQPLTGSPDGLLVFDSIGGPDLGERIRLTRAWREFTLYRAVPESGKLTVTFALTGLGEAWVDDLSVSLLNPEPIRPVR